MYAIETGCVACVRMYGDRCVFLGEKMKPKTGDRTERKGITQNDRGEKWFSGEFCWELKIFFWSNDIEQNTILVSGSFHKNESKPRPELLNLSFGMYFQCTDEIRDDEMEEWMETMRKQVSTQDSKQVRKCEWDLEN